MSVCTGPTPAPGQLAQSVMDVEGREGGREAEPLGLKRTEEKKRIE